MNNNYHQTRFSYDIRREKLWICLVNFYFSKFVSKHFCVVDFGCGYGSFINNIKADNKIAIDNWEGFTQYLADDVKPYVKDITEIDFLADASIDFAFASNLFEHVSKEDFSLFLGILKTKLKDDGVLTILQPNYRFCYREYFDDYTHKSIYTHISLSDFLSDHGYEVMECLPKFMPFSIKSGMPVHPFLIWLYLKLPFKFKGKQMLLRVMKKD